MIISYETMKKIVQTYTSSLNVLYTTDLKIDPIYGRDTVLCR